MDISIKARRTAGTFAVLLALIAAACTASPAAFAAGTGDDPTPTQDTLTARESAQKARLERDTSALLDATGDTGKGGITILAADIPNRYLWTPTHKQERSYFCGPATCQVIDDYFGDYVSQSTYGLYLGTTTNGTDFSRVDDCLRRFASKPYYYYGGLVQSGFYAHVMDSLLNHGMPLAADVNIIASVWPNYERDHPGHIVPIEAFDWRVWTVRLNDVFNEADYGGGYTLGHTTYDRAVVWNGVYNHFRRAVVSAP